MNDTKADPKLVELYRSYATALEAFKELHHRKKVDVKCGRYTGPGILVKEDGCPPDKAPVLLGNGNIWWYPLESITVIEDIENKESSDHFADPVKMVQLGVQRVEAWPPAPREKTDLEVEWESARADWKKGNRAEPCRCGYHDRTDVQVKRCFRVEGHSGEHYV